MASRLKNGDAIYCRTITFSDSPSNFPLVSYLVFQLPMNDPVLEKIKHLGE